MQQHYSIEANLVDFWTKSIYQAKVIIENGLIKKIERTNFSGKNDLPYLMPGFVDSHVHIESSMLVPSEFARLAVIHGTVATVSDPHEIANVCGAKGVQYMLDNARQTPFHFYFGAPSCVPATIFETAGAALNSDAVTSLLANPEIFYLSEMMNFPGVLNNDEEVLKKIKAATACHKPVDGHAPGLSGEAAKKYIQAGISTDHECFTYEEALWKLQCGMKIIIREGSAAKNFDALIPLLRDYPDYIMFCSDDKHPDSLVEGHIQVLCKRARAAGIPLFHIITAACINPVLHYKLPHGILRENDAADFILVNDLYDFHVLKTFIRGNMVADNGQTFLPSIPVAPINHFHCTPIDVKDVHVPYQNHDILPVIEAIDGQLVTHTFFAKANVIGGNISTDIGHDILKLVVVNRYQQAPPAIAFIKNFGLQHGAIGSTVAHDSHNIIAVGADDDSIVRAINLLIQHQGGVCCVSDQEEEILPLPVAGLMSSEDGFLVAEKYAALDKKAKAMGSPLSAPFMTLSFMALLVIPEIKLSDKGLFNGIKFKFIKP